MIASYLHRYTGIACLFMVVFLALSSCATQDSRHGSKYTYDQRSIVIEDSLKDMFTQSLIHMKKGEYEEAINLLEQFTSREPRLAAPLVNLGIAYNRTDNIKKSEQYFIAALRINVGHAIANNELGLLYRRSGKFGAARSSYQNALAEHPDYLPARKNLGILCELYLQDMACAIEQYEAYLEYSPDDELISRWLQELKQRTQLR